MKILFFIPSLYSGGRERRLVELLKGLKAYYPSIMCELVITRKEIHYTEVLNLGIKIHVLERRGTKKDPRLFWKFYKIAKQFKPDIIHVWENMVAFYAIPTKIFLNIPMINNQISDAPLYLKKGLFSYKIPFFFSDLIIANSYAGLKSYKSPENKSTVIYNGFDFKRVKNIKCANEIRLKFNIKTPFVIGMVASFSNHKDYRTYLNAAISILYKRNDVTFLCIGAGDDRKYRTMIPTAFMKKILFLGRQKNVEDIMNICDIGVLTSNVNTHGEGISNAIMEFFSLAKPVIATNNGGTLEIINNKKNGLLVKPFDYIDLEKKLEFLLVNKNDKLTMGIQAKNTIEKKFGIERMIKEFVTCYKKISYNKKNDLKKTTNKRYKINL